MQALFGADFGKDVDKNKNH